MSDEFRPYGDGSPAIKCKKCKDVIQSKSQHDFKGCSCKAVHVDGGYGGHYRICGNPGDYIRDYGEILNKDGEWVDELQYLIDNSPFDGEAG